MRKLAIGALAFSAAITAANFILDRSLVLYAAVILAFLGALVLGIRLKSLRGVVIAAFCAALGFCVYALHYDLTTQKAHDLSGETVHLSFRLTDFPEEYSNYTRVDAQLYEKGYPRLNAILYDSERRLENLSAGDIVSGEYKLSAADIRFGEHTDRYQSKDIYLTASVKSDLMAIGRRNSLSTLTAIAARSICQRIELIFPSDSAAFMKALMLGDKRDLYQDDALYVSLSRAGLMHVVAVSGMHVSYLVGFLRLLFGKGRRSAILCILCVWGFVLMSGLTPSAMRAAFMQTLLLIAPLFGREDDPITSLSSALAFLLLLNPYAVANISLQLSFTAMLGQVLFAEPLNRRMLHPFGEGKLAELMRRPVGSLASSLSVQIFTLPVAALSFGYVCILAPLTNVLTLFAVPFCFVGGYLACLLSIIPAAGTFAANAVSLLVRYLVFVCRKIAGLSLSTIYLPTKWILIWCGLVCVIVFALFTLFRKGKGKAAICFLTAYVILFSISGGLHAHYRSAFGTVTAIDVGQGQCLCVMAGESAVLVDCGSTSYAEYNAGERAAAYLKSCGIKKVDALVFTHLHADHANGLERLSNLIPIGKLILPLSVNDSDHQLLDILRCAAAHQIAVEWVGTDQIQLFGEIKTILLTPGETGDENERCMPAILSVGDYSVISTGDASAAREEELARRADLSGIDAVVIGHHGSKSASSPVYLEEIGGRCAIISVGKNTYGLPSEQTLERLASFGYTVYRTDLDGNVELRIDG